MFCPRCRRRLGRNSSICRSCGHSLATGSHPTLDLVLPDGTHVPITQTLTLGRGADNSIRLSHPTISRSHAVITVIDGRVSLDDAGSSYGTFLDGAQVSGPVPIEGEGRIELGDLAIHIERPRAEAEEGRTLVVRAGLSVMVPAAGASELSSTAAYGFRPRVRSGWALKRLEAKEGEQRYILRDLRAGTFVRMLPEEAELFQRLDGGSSLADLIVEAEERYGAAGPARLARLLADLGERGLLADTQPGDEPAPSKRLFARLLTPREISLRGAEKVFDRLYRKGGFLLLTTPALAIMTALAAGGLAAFVLLQIHKEAAPFVVAGSLALGALIFMTGRIVIVLLHEFAHGLVLTSFGRQVGKVGLKFVFWIPFAFVDTSEAWFEPRRRRLTVAAAGPASDLVAGGAFSIAAVGLEPASWAGGIFFQMALAAYLGALFNLNPFLERDGYQLLVDVLRQPNLRQRARERLAGRLSGGPSTQEPRAVAIYGVATLVWSVVSVLFLVLVSTRNNYDRLLSVAPAEVVWVVLACVYSALLVPIILFVARPLLQGRRRSRLGVEGEIV
jgi:putative peptide zinc metalloprotease protein